LAKIKTPLALLERDLASMLYVERELTDSVLPALLERIADTQLEHAFERHLVQTRGHVANLEQAFSLLGEEPEPEKNAAFDGLGKEHDRLVKSLGDERLEDIVHAAAATQIEHYEIAAYKGMIDLAESVGETEIVHLLEENLDQEREALAQVKQIATQLATQHATA
jgi:ferritin-like metal-binding protein YciE